MSKGRASTAKLDELHNLFATYLLGMLEPFEDEEGKLVKPSLSAPEMAVIAKFLRDNNIASVGDDEDDETAALKASLRKKGRAAGFSDTDIELALEGAAYGRAH